MLATVRAALDEAERVGRDAPAERIAAAVSLGALMGARGNSGVITSQILRGVAEGLAGKKRFNGLDLANALDARHEDRVRRGRQAGRGHDPHGHPRVVGRGGRGGRARRRDGVGPRGDRRRRPASPSPGRRRSCRSCARPASSTRAARACSACSRARCSASGAGRSTSAAGAGAGLPHGEARDAPSRRRSGPASRRSRTTRSATRRSSSSPRRRRHEPRRPGDPGPPRGARQLGPRRRRRPDGQGPRPQRAAGRGHRLRAVARDADPDHRREPRHDGRRRPRGAGVGVRRREATPARGTAGGRGGARAGVGVAARPAAAVATQALPAAASREPATNGAHGPDAVDDRSRRSAPRSSPSSPATGSRRLFLETSAPHHIVRGGQTANPSTGELLRIARLAKAARGHPPARTTRTSGSRPSRRRGSARTAGSSSSRPATPPRASPRSSPTSRRSTRPRTSGR